MDEGGFAIIRIFTAKSFIYETDLHLSQWLCH